MMLKLNFSPFFYLTRCILVFLLNFATFSTISAGKYPPKTKDFTLLKVDSLTSSRVLNIDCNVSSDNSLIASYCFSLAPKYSYGILE